MNEHTLRPRRLALDGLVAPLVIAGAIGCANIDTPTGPETTYSGTVTEDGVELEQGGDPGLARDLVMESVRTRRLDDRLQVQFDLRNDRRTRLEFEWTILWFDAAGFRIDTELHWTPASIGGDGIESITRTAPVPAATGFRLSFRRPAPIN